MLVYYLCHGFPLLPPRDLHQSMSRDSAIFVWTECVMFAVFHFSWSFLQCRCVGKVAWYCLAVFQFCSSVENAQILLKPRMELSMPHACKQCIGFNSCKHHILS